MSNPKKGRVLVVSRVSMFPSEHGGAKNIRSIVTSLTREGIECRVLVKMHPRGVQKQRFLGQHHSDLERLAKDRFNQDSLKWNVDGIQYIGVEGDSNEIAKHAECEIQTFKPNAVFLCDDGLDDSKELFKVAAQSGKLVFLAQTIHCLPFGPYSMNRSPEVASYIRQAAYVIAPSQFVANYIETHLGKSASVYYPPVFGAAPFTKLGRYENKYVTFINPCPWKGSSIFKRLARARPDINFAVVPTWGATVALMTELSHFANVAVLEETPEIDKIFAQTRVLLVPSLCQEAFGLVSPEALLRGVPVIASQIGGLPESTLGIAKTIPVKPLSFERLPKMDGHPQLGWDEPINEIQPWSDALDEILGSRDHFERVSTQSKAKAEAFVSSLAKQSIRTHIGLDG